MLYSQHYLSFKCQEFADSCCIVSTICPLNFRKSIVAIYTFKQSLAINRIDICLAMDVSEDQVCVICKKPIELLPKVTLGEKGSATINRVSKERNETLQCESGDQVHQECRRNTKSIS